MTGGRAGPVKKVDPDDVARLAGQGHGRNSCARVLGTSRRQIDEAAKVAGIDWTRAATQAATAARLADSRADLSEMFATAADLAGDRLITALQADVLDPSTLRALATVCGISADKLIALGDRVAATEDRGDSLLDRLAAGIGEWAEALANQADTEQHPEHKETER